MRGVTWRGGGGGGGAKRPVCACVCVWGGGGGGRNETNLRWLRRRGGDKCAGGGGGGRGGGGARVMKQTILGLEGGRGQMCTRMAKLTVVDCKVAVLGGDEQRNKPSLGYWVRGRERTDVHVNAQTDCR